jgi:hypothetical protein
MIKVLAGQLAAALSKTAQRAGSKRSKPIIVSIEYRVESGALSVVEAKNAVFATSLDAEGDLVGATQIDGRPLYKYASSWPPETHLEITTNAEHLIVRTGSSIVKIPRTDDDGRKPIVRKPLPIDKKHKGKVEIPPDPVRLAEPLADMWSFSARVPMPSHRIGKQKKE